MAGLSPSLKRRDYSDSVSATRTYAYNTAMELCRVVEPETGATLNGYDAAGNLAWSASGLPANSTCDAEGDTTNIQNRIVKRGYDQRNRINLLDFVDDRGNTTYTYTPDGLQQRLDVTNFAGNTVTTEYAYNARRLMTSETMTFGTLIWPVGYSYEKHGHLASQAYPGNVSVNYAPNALGQATQAGSYATGVKYYPNGGIAEFTYGNGIKHALAQNARMLPERSSDTYGSTAFLDDTYDYDVNGNVLSITDRTSGSRGNRTMEYDDLDRLVSVTSPMYSATSTPGTMTFGYDVLDNITSVRAWNRTLKYCYDDGTNRLTMIRSPWNTSCTTGAATTALAYDVQGNVASKNNTTYELDFGNRLRSSSDGTTSTTYVYDAAGRRVRDITGSSRYSLYTQAGQVAYTSDARKREATNYIYLAGSLVATSRLPTGSSTPIVEYQHTDALGTPVVVTNASRGIVQKSEYEPYGSVINRPKTDGIGFTGHVEDGATGLTYMQQRYYDPLSGRILSIDPVAADQDSFNRYWYANNNPYRFTDPDGRQSVGELINSGAEGCGAVSCAGWAVLSATWSVLGAEGVSQVLDKGQGASTGNKVMAGVEVLTLGQGGKVGAGAKVVKSIAGALGNGAEAAAASKTAGELFFDGAKVSERVAGQMKTDALHGFSDAVDGFAARDGVVKTVLDSRGKPVEMLTVRGGLGKKEGTFEYIKNQAGEIYHRFFKADP